MPRRGRGGARTADPGTAHPNRSDLNMPGGATVMRDSVRPYGDRTPPSSLPQGAPPGADAAAPPPRPSGPPPGALTPLDAPTQRPDEPLTAGMPFGPGDGPEASLDSPDPHEVLLAAYQIAPTPALARLLGYAG